MPVTVSQDPESLQLSNGILNHNSSLSDLMVARLLVGGQLAAFWLLIRQNSLMSMLDALIATVAHNGFIFIELVCHSTGIKERFIMLRTGHRITEPGQAAIGQNQNLCFEGMPLLFARIGPYAS